VIQTQPESFMTLGPMILIFLVALPLTLLLTVLPFWFICKKAGFHPALSLLMLIPFGNIVLPFIVAFAQWPVLKGQPEVVEGRVPGQ